MTNAHFEPLARRAGLAFHSLGPAEAYQRTVSDPRLFTGTLPGLQTFVRELFGPSVEPLYRAIAESAAREPTVVAASAFAFGARIAQDHLGVPVATVHLQPTLLPTIHDLPTMPGWVGPGARRMFLRVGVFAQDRLFGGAVQELRRTLGLPPPRGVLSNWGQSPLRIIGLFPEWYAPPQPDSAARAVRLGTGASISPKAYRADAVAGHLQRLLTDREPQKRCQAASERIRSDPGLTEACALLEELVLQGATLPGGRYSGAG